MTSSVAFNTDCDSTGSAMDALQSMEKYLSTRPTRFASLALGIEWQYVINLPPCSFLRLLKQDSTRSRTIRNTTSARASVPSLLYEESNPADRSRPWVWRTDLSATKPFWENWFVGLSRKFLDARGGKLLLLAGTDRLDKELMIGHMQGSYLFSHSSVGFFLSFRFFFKATVHAELMAGKYQLQVFPQAGHFIQEDHPAKTAQILVDFYKRNDRSALVLPPKVADMQATAAMNKDAGLDKAGSDRGTGQST